jgi:hypothetical protein
VLIHGFLAATRGKQGQEPAQSLEKITGLYLEEHPRNAQWLRAAAFTFLVSHKAGI